LTIVPLAPSFSVSVTEMMFASGITKSETRRAACLRTRPNCRDPCRAEVAPPSFDEAACKPARTAGGVPVRAALHVARACGDQECGSGCASL
jgi:hypothetical protein